MKSFEVTSLKEAAEVKRSIGQLTRKPFVHATTMVEFAKLLHEAFDSVEKCNVRLSLGTGVSLMDLKISSVRFEDTTKPLDERVLIFKWVAMSKKKFAISGGFMILFRYMSFSNRYGKTVGSGEDSVWTEEALVHVKLRDLPAMLKRLARHNELKVAKWQHEKSSHAQLETILADYEENNPEYQALLTSRQELETEIVTLQKKLLEKTTKQNKLEEQIKQTLSENFPFTDAEELMALDADPVFHN